MSIIEGSHFQEYENYVGILNYMCEKQTAKL
jgi:hypothetical protein